MSINLSELVVVTDRPAPFTTCLIGRRPTADRLNRMSSIKIVASAGVRPPVPHCRVKWAAMPHALEVIVAVSAWLMRSVVASFGGGSVVVRAVFHLASLVRWLHARWASRHLLRSKATVSHGEAEWLAYAHAPVDERSTLLWLPGGAFICHDAWEVSTQGSNPGLAAPRQLAKLPSEPCLPRTAERGQGAAAHACGASDQGKRRRRCGAAARCGAAQCGAARRAAYPRLPLPTARAEGGLR